MMRDPYEDPHPACTTAMMADLTGAGMPPGSRAEPVGSETGSGRCTVDAGAATALRRAGEGRLDIREGGIYRRRDGVEYRVTRAHPRSGWAWWGEDGIYYDDQGKAFAGYHEFDLMAEVGTTEREHTSKATTVAAMEAARRGEHDDTPADWFGCWVKVHNVYATAQRLMAEAGPMPLVSSEPWVEEDEAYRERLGLTPSERCSDLDELGAWRDFPRARLVLVENV